MDEFFIWYIYCAVTLNVIGVAVGISRWATARKATRVFGKVTDIEPILRGAYYTVEINFHGENTHKRFYKRNLFGGYSIDSSIEFYRIESATSYSYKSVSGYYKWTWGLLIFPWIPLIGTIK